MSSEVAVHVAQMIKDNDEKFRSDLNILIQNDWQQEQLAITKQRAEIVTHWATLVDQEARIGTLITDKKAKHDVIVNDIRAQQALLHAQQARADQSLNKTMGLDSRFEQMDVDVKQTSANLTQLGLEAKLAIDNVDVDAKQTRTPRGNRAYE